MSTEHLKLGYFNVNYMKVCTSTCGCYATGVDSVEVSTCTRYSRPGVCQLTRSIVSHNL
jgi:hypothetical protein